MKRDLVFIKQTLDLEHILQHYGYEFVRSKSSVKSRVYRKGDRRLSVIVDNSYSAKYFTDLSDPDFKGDIFKFLERMEQGNYRRIFEIIDEMLEQQGIIEKTETAPKSSIPPPAERSDVHSLLREKELYRIYRITPLTDTVYLEARAITTEVLFSKEFAGRVKNVTAAANHSQYVNTGFPMYDREGNMVSMDIRNVGYKAFPEGERGEALWHSNFFFSSGQMIKIENGIEIPSATIGTVFRLDAASYVFTYGELGNEKRVELSEPQFRAEFYEVPVHRIIVSESAIDAISLKQLSPEWDGERRLYVATCGQPGTKQMTFIQQLLRKHPQAQLVIAQDGDAAGLRFSINYLALQHPSEDPEKKIIPHLTYGVSGHHKAEQSNIIATNKLHLELRYTLASGARKVQTKNEEFIRDLSREISRFDNRFLSNEQPIETRLDENMKYMITRFSFHFSNDVILMTQVLQWLTEEIERRQQQKLFHCVCLNRHQKDLNNLLKHQKGRALSSFDVLYLQKLF